MTRYRFATCTLDVGRREVVHDGETVKLSRRAFEALHILLKNYPSAVCRDDLYEALWPKTFVNLTNLNNVIAQIRSAVGDRAKKIVVTKHRFGYVIGVPVNEVALHAPSSRFTLAIGGRTIVLRDGENLVGRADDAAVPLDQPSISRHHATIRIEGDRAELEDLRSKNGTFIGDHRVTEPRELSDRDIVRFGSVCGTFLSAPAASTLTEPAGKRPR
jgi:DNA-binding winged helix-turn-helix (wHTH) protein